ncbi:MAG: metallophosphoesterase [Thermoplasmata archaeon]
MGAPSVRPVLHHAALRLEGPSGRAPEIAVADLHLGLGSLGGEGLVFAQGRASEMAREIQEVAREEGARGVIVAGDVKHPIFGASAPVGRILFEFFSTLLASGLRVRVVPGNHDQGLARHLPREVEMIEAGGLLRGTVGLFHGHAWPSDRLGKARTLVAGHLHPGYRLAPGRIDGGKQRCWIRVALGPSIPPRPRRTLRAEELIVLPAFNPLSGIEPLNQKRPASGRSFLFSRFLARGTARAYLLDGTDLGELRLDRRGRIPLAAAGTGAVDRGDAPLPPRDGHRRASTGGRTGPIPSQSTPRRAQSGR